MLVPSVTEKPKFINNGRKVNRPNIRIFGNKNKYGSDLVPNNF
jgi:hypothetical protein